MPKDGNVPKRKAEAEMAKVVTDKKSAKTRKYDEAYLNFGFTSIAVSGEIRPQCVVCAVTLANDSLKPTKLRRHLETKHGDVVGKNRDFFRMKVTRN